MYEKNVCACRFTSRPGGGSRTPPSWTRRHNAARACRRSPASKLSSCFSNVSIISQARLESCDSAGVAPPCASPKFSLNPLDTRPLALVKSPCHPGCPGLRILCVQDSSNHARRRLSRPERPPARNRAGARASGRANCSSRSPSAASAPPTSRKSNTAPCRPRASSATKPPAPSSAPARARGDSSSATAWPCTITCPAWIAMPAATAPSPNARNTSAPASPPDSSPPAAATPNMSGSCGLCCRAW